MNHVKFHNKFDSMIIFIISDKGAGRSTMYSKVVSHKLNVFDFKLISFVFTLAENSQMTVSVIQYANQRM